MYSISNIDELCDNQESGKSSKAQDEEDKHEPEPVASFTEAHPAYRSVRSFFYAHSIGKHNKQNTLSCELTLFCLKHSVSTRPLSTGDFFGEKDVVSKQVLK
jgi:hypothetical protein